VARFATNPWDIGDLLVQLDKCRVGLPQFQRSFVWRPIDIDLLITSLIQDYPAGSLLFVRADTGIELAWRPVEGVESDGTPVPDYLVLDGQQRLTSLSLALNGRGDHLFFMDMELLEEGDFENGVYPLRRTVAAQRGLLKREQQWDAHTYPVFAAVGALADGWWFQDYVEHHVADGGDRDALRARVQAFEQSFVRPLREYRFPVVELPANTSLDAVCQIFETLNKTGVKLTVFDLLTAKFWPDGLNLRSLLNDARGEYPLLGEDGGFDVDATYLLQAIALLRSGLCKRSDLLRLKRENFEQDWEKVTAAASASLRMLRNECGVLVREWLPYVALFPSLFAVATKALELKGPAAGAAWQKIERWFWCCCFSQRYDGPPNTLNAQDVRQVSAWLEDDDALPESVASFSAADLDLRRVERQRAALYRSVICLTIVHGARDFYTGQRLTHDLLSEPASRIEDHHLFPTGFLAKQQPPRGAESSILNRCLIDHKTNKVISDKAPSIYLAAIEGHLGSATLEQVLRSHLIPDRGPGAIQNDNLEPFLNARESMVRQAIADATGTTLASEGTSTVAYLDPARPYSNELALRRVLRQVAGTVLWYEQHLPGKALELLSDELDRQTVTRLRLLSGPANITERTTRAFGRFRNEMASAGIDCDWRVLPADEARQLHARVIFADNAAWELPPVNTVLTGSVDSIRQSHIPSVPFERAWTSPSAQSLTKTE
jgi:hypothetical protein